MNLALAGLVGALVALSGCDPRVFDDIADEAWVQTSGPPSGLSTQAYGVALIVGGEAPGVGARLFAVSRNQDGFVHLVYDADGALEANATVLTDVGVNGVYPLSSQPITVGDPASSRVAMAVQSGSPPDQAHLLVLDAATGQRPSPAFALAGGVPVTAIAFGGAEGASGPNTLTVALENLLVRIPDVATPTADPPRCLLPAGIVTSLAIAELDAGSPGPELVVSVTGTDSAPGEILLLPGDVIEAAGAAGPDGPLDCLDPNAQPPLASVSAPAGESDFGHSTRLADLDGDGGLDLVASAPGANRVYLLLGAFAGDPAIEIAGPANALGFGETLAVGPLDGDGGVELVVGAPGTPQDGEVAAGAAYLYRLSAGAVEPPAVLADAQPEANQRFGQSVAMVPFGDGSRSLLVVGAGTEVFAYFRTPFSDELRP
ncbi:integrin alpha [Haliangium sp.]|uniref:integrin alpha n=1 Tax=Haliangium sp. TaxID=2663208 RepID=UPI003D0DE958